MPELLTIVPSRGRPAAVTRLAQAWQTTHAHTDADLLLALDTDDPALPEYLTAVAEVGVPWLQAEMYGPWQPMVPKLNLAAKIHSNSYTALGFAGDDHLPRTPGWARLYLEELTRLRIGIVYSNDGVWQGRLSTEWAMSAAIVRRLGRMVPAHVDHLYCDNVVMELGRGADCLTYLDQVLIEHMHPSVGKATPDPGYAAVNAPDRYRADESAVIRWRRYVKPGQVAAVRVLRAATLPR